MKKTKCFSKLFLLSLPLWVGLAGLTSCTEEVVSPTLNGNVAQPAWTAPADYDYTSSMTAVIKVSLSEKYPSTSAGWQLKDEDVLAAFIGDVCCGVVSPQDGLFYLYIAGPTSNSLAVSLRYYSAHYKNIFEAKEVFEFKNDDHLGTVSEPFMPVFVVAK